MKRKFKLFAIALAFVMMFTISITSDMKVVSAAEGSGAAGSSVVDDLDYLGDKYDMDDHVYQVLTVDRFDLILENDAYNGDSIFVLGHWSDDTDNNASLAAIPAINDAAKDAGIENIYYFDMNLAGEYGVNIWNNHEYFTAITSVDDDITSAIKTAQGASSVADITADNAFVQLGNYYRTALADVLNAGYEDAETQVALFVANGKNGSAYNVKDVVVIEDVADVDAKEADIEALLSGVTNETNYTNFDYFNDSAKWQIDTFGYEFATTGYDQFEEGFLLRSVTYYEMMYMLDLAGEHTFLMTGSWCGDSRTALPLVIKYAHKNSYDQPIYVFDFNLNSRLHSTARASIVDYAGYSVNSYRIAYLGAAMQDKFGADGFPTGQANNNLSYIENGGVVEDGVLTGDVVTQNFKRYRSPYLARYNKAEGGITEAWLHETQDWEIGVASDPNTDGVYTDEGAYEVGSLTDTELASGNMSQTQMAYTRYQLSVFFGADEIVYQRPVANINESPDSSLDSGCGDDNDPMDNNASEAKLIPYHGTDDYDVSLYDIDIALIEDSSIIYGDYSSVVNQKFKATTVITATANTALSAISLDFRQQEISALSVTVDDQEVALNTTKGNGTGYTRINDNNTDQQKLFVWLNSSIAAGTEFKVSVTYEILTVDFSTIAANMGGKTDKVHGFNVHTDNMGFTVAGEPFGATYWMPCNNTPADGAKYEITMYAPAGWTMVSNGVRQGNQKAVTSGEYMGYNTVTWKVDNEIAGYQTFATFSCNMITLQQTGAAATSNVTGSDKNAYNWTQGMFETADGRQIPIYAYVNKDTYYQYQEYVDRYFGMLPYYIRTLESAFGAYPGESLGFVMEDVGDGHGSSASWGAIECYDRPFYTYGTLVGENTFVHELVHQWFGDAVRLNDWESLWLNEGFATFGSDLYYELTNQGDTLHEKWGNLYSQKGTTSQLWAVAPANLPNESDMFGGAKAAYNRGAMALTVLKDGLGDEMFFDVIDAWSHDYQGQAADTEDFIAHVKSMVSNDADIDAWANAWLYGTEKPAAFTLTGVAANSGDNGSGDNGSGDNGSGDNGSGDNGSGDNGSADNGSGDNNGSDDENGGIGTWGIIGIVAGCIVVVGAIVVAVLYVKKRK